MANSVLSTLANYLIGEFENQAQSAAEPTWYVHLRLWQRLVPSLSTADVYTLFLEQASVAANKPPYRQRILQLSDRSNQLRAQYFALSQPSRFVGAGANPQQLAELSADELVSLPNSEAHIQYEPLAGSPGSYQFRAALPDGQLCSFEYESQRRYVYLGFDIAPQATGFHRKGLDSSPNKTPNETIELLIHDKGIDPDTGRGLWGALMGPFRMVKKT
jgi:hypothetical protein